jgi:hypothetical protein
MGTQLKVLYTKVVYTGTRLFAKLKEIMFNLGQETVVLTVARMLQLYLAAQRHR